MKNVKIVIGANYGDEGKGLMTRHFTLDANRKGLRSVIVFHNGTAQRGHTVDYSPDLRHVYHHFGSGSADGANTFFAESFLIHPMEFHREYMELSAQGMTPPFALFDPKAKVITPLDMVVDHATEEWIAILNGEREFGSCGFGSWCATEDRIPMGRTAYTIWDFMLALDNEQMVTFLMEEIWKDCLGIITKRGVDIERTSLANVAKDRTAIIKNFINDLKFFRNHAKAVTFDTLFNDSIFDSFIFENGQGLGLDMDVNNPWHTTSKTGMHNPIQMLHDKKDFNAEVCYVTRSYLTRHGVGPLEEAVKKEEINDTMYDKTNVPNEFQGTMRYGYIEDNDQADRIIKDYTPVMCDNRFKFNMAVTHTNEFECNTDGVAYISNNPYSVEVQKR